MTKPIVIATHLPQAAAQSFFEGLENADLRFVGPDLSQLDPDVECLIPLPATHIGPVTQPADWPGSVRWVQLPSSGVDGYPDWLFDRVPVAGMQGVNAVAVAELAMAFVIAAAKRLPEVWSESKTWQSIPIGDLAGATLGIVGFGAIGQALAQRAAAFGMNILALRASNRPMPEYVTRAASADEIFASSDHVVLSLPSSPETTGMVDAALLDKAKAGVHLVNVARGELIDETALLAALDSGKVALASLDVLSPEPPPADHPLLHHPRVRVSAHVGGNTRGAVRAMADRIRANVDAYREGRPFEGLITRD